MAQSFKEVAHLRTDKSKYDENYDRIFGDKTKRVIEGPKNFSVNSGPQDVVSTPLNTIRLLCPNQEIIITPDSITWNGQEVKTVENLHEAFRKFMISVGMLP